MKTAWISHYFMGRLRINIVVEIDEVDTATKNISISLNTFTCAIPMLIFPSNLSRPWKVIFQDLSMPDWLSGKKARQKVRKHQVSIFFSPADCR